jgi:hypothetical protein
VIFLLSELVLKSAEKTQISSKRGKDFGHFTRTPKYPLLVPTTMNRHKRDLSEQNGTRLPVRPSVFLFVRMSVCPSFCSYHFMYQRRSHWKNSCETSYRGLSRKTVDKQQIYLKSDKNIGYFTQRPN